MSTTNPLRPTALRFAYLSYTGQLRTDIEYTTTDLKTELETNIANNTNLAGKWDVVWGPVTYTMPGAVMQMNMMYVVKEKTTDQYIVAIRGTNGTADLNWLVEDFDVGDMVVWQPQGSSVFPDPDGPYNKPAMISEATSVGLEILLKMQDLTLTQTLEQYLKSVADAATASWGVTVTGHSLGGALAPTLALYLKMVKHTWNTNSYAAVSCIPFAGPTPGNYAFATLAEQTFSQWQSGGTTYQSYLDPCCVSVPWHNPRFTADGTSRPPRRRDCVAGLGTVKAPLRRVAPRRLVAPRP